MTRRRQSWPGVDLVALQSPQGPRLMLHHLWLAAPLIQKEMTLSAVTLWVPREKGHGLRHQVKDATYGCLFPSESVARIPGACWPVSLACGTQGYPLVLTSLPVHKCI